MVKQFIVDNNNIHPIIIPEGLLSDTIPTAIYTVKQSVSGYYLQHTKDIFEMPLKLYGTTKARSKRIQTAYTQNTGSTGVLLTGLKGAGKSLLIKEVANAMLKKRMPVVIIQDNYKGSDFMAFMELIGECVVLLDEFGKTYKTANKDSENEQHSLLSFFDGLYSTKRLILLAENKLWDISDLFIDRPSRVLFHWKYTTLEEDVVVGYCKDTLHSKKLSKKILSVYRTASDFTFDSLKALVSQCNMFKDLPFKTILEGLNIPTGSSNIEKITVLKKDGKNILKSLKHFYSEGYKAYTIVVLDKKTSRTSFISCNADSFIRREGTTDIYKISSGNASYDVHIKNNTSTFKYSRNAA